MVVSQEVLQTITQVGLHSYLNNMGYVSHAEAIAHQKIAGFVAYRN
jgi:hypothetical protein